MPLPPRTHLGLATLIISIALPGCSSNPSTSSSGRTEIVPDIHRANWRDEPLWFNSPTLVTPANSPDARRRREAQNRERQQLAAQRRANEVERLQLQSDRAALQAEKAGQPPTLDTRPRVRLPTANTPLPPLPPPTPSPLPRPSTQPNR